MSARKSHTKSRYGCDWCRKRKVKCDENGPPCDNCILRELDNCTYSRIPPARRLGLARGTGPPSNEACSAPPGTPPQVPSGVDDLELMHTFSTQTYKSLGIDHSEDHIWQMVVPRLALDHRYLMDGILSLASIHIATTVVASPAASKYIDAGLQYHNRSLAPFRTALDNITPRNCNAVFAQSIVIVAISIALPQVLAGRGAAEPRDGSGSQGMIETVITCFELLQGVKKILSAGHSWIDLSLFSNGEFWRRDGDDSAGEEQLDEGTTTTLEFLASLSGKPVWGEGNNEHHDIRQRAISHLGYCFTKFARSPDPAPVLAWLAAVDEVFIKDIQQGHPLCRLILVCWATLLDELEEHRWWAHNSGRALVSELSSNLQSGLRGNIELAEWDACIGWVQGRIGFKLPRWRTR